eukprot:PITA_04967
MLEEYDSIIKNNVWEVVPRPTDKSVVGLRWLFKVKHEGDGGIKKYKARFVAKGFSQVEGIDNEETFAPVARTCKEDLASKFEMKCMGLMHYFLRLEVWKGDEELFVSQGKYESEILKKFHMESSKPMESPLATSWRKEDATLGEVVEVTIYRQLVRSLLYLVNTRPNMCYAINQLSEAMVRPTKLFWRVANHVLRYLRGTIGLWYR